LYFVILIMKSINPYTNQVIAEYPEHSSGQVSEIIQTVHETWLQWKETSFEQRSYLFRNAAQVLRDGKDEYARLITSEMGKIIRESQAEVEKCAVACDFYADHAAEMLMDEVIPSDATSSFVTFEPLGVILAVMPWNFPFWQVFRFAVPTLMAGNAGVLKHASNVPGCALAIEDIFRKAGFPPDLFRTLLIPSSMVEGVIANPMVSAVTLTGSEGAGSHVASVAGKHIKKTVLELGGSDPFIVLEDADMEAAVKTAVTARMINQGQSCIAAKRFIVAEKVAGVFEARIKDEFEKLIAGDPMDPATQVGPMARPDLVDEIGRQVRESVEMGARLITGGYRDARIEGWKDERMEGYRDGVMPDAGCFYSPTVLTDVGPGMPVYDEETFGPVVAIIRVKNEEEAVSVANDTEFGLGGSVWTKDLVRGERVARKVTTGAMFVNGLVKSDPRLPFGGIGKSGYGRELSAYGIKEFVNVKTIWVG
jgi:succinate-semialdehyde dehydrogenase/glutarate-semialdehyde dehydrogenase